MFALQRLLSDERHLQFKRDHILLHMHPLAMIVNPQNSPHQSRWHVLSTDSKINQASSTSDMTLICTAHGITAARTMETGFCL